MTSRGLFWLKLRVYKCRTNDKQHSPATTSEMDIHPVKSVPLSAMEKKAVGKYGRTNRASRSKKRTYHGNKKQESSTSVIIENSDTVVEQTQTREETVEQPQTLEETVTVVDAAAAKRNQIDPSCSSAKKLKPIAVPTAMDAPECNVLMNTLLLKTFIEKVAKCPECEGDITFQHEIKKKKGMAHFFRASCSSEICDWTEVLASSKPCGAKRGQKGYEINLRTMIAFREIGRGYQSIVAFMKLMNSPPPMDSKTYRKRFTELYRAYTEAALASTNAAAAEVSVTPEEDGIRDVRASFDGTWQRRGYSSLNGVVSCISDEKVVDYEVLTKVCRPCQYWKKKKTSSEYEQWKLTHDCAINHTGSAGSMEAAGVLKIFKRSIENKGLRYMKYLGDGDSKAFSNVVEANVYPGKKPSEKEECIGHVQKKVGTHLRTLKKNYKGVVLSDGKKLTGLGRLTEKVMNTLQNYYGMVIRSNCHSLYQMKKGVAAILFHCSEYLNDNGEPDLDQRHKFCPAGATSWCNYQRDKVTGENTYKTKINIPVAVRDVIKPIFSHADLGSDELLGKCLHGLTQNCNEAFNQIIWKKAPKDVFVARKTLEVSVASAVLSYNDGGNGILNVCDKVGISCGHYTLLGCAKSDAVRKRFSTIKSTEKRKQERKKQRAQRKGWQDSIKANEEKSYSAGAF